MEPEKFMGNQTRDEEDEIPVIVKNTTEIIELGKHVIIGPTATNVENTMTTTKNSTSNHVAIVSTTEPWKPITKHMILEIINEKINNTTTTTGATETDDDKFLNHGERIPKKTKTEKRSFDNYEYVNSLAENTISVTSSTMKTTTTSTANIKVVSEKMDDMATSTEMEKMITVQLFPIRLADIFEKAEKYAKNTLFPFISESFLSFFNGKANNETSDDAPIVLERISSISSDKNDYRTSEEIDEKIIQNFKFLQKNSNTLDELPKPIEKMIPEVEITALTEMMPIHIDLPTYRPETMQKRGNKFIPVSIQDEK
jgi:hypothetical protein